MTPRAASRQVASLMGYPADEPLAAMEEGRGRATLCCLYRDEAERRVTAGQVSKTFAASMARDGSSVFVGRWTLGATGCACWNQLLAL